MTAALPPPDLRPPRAVLPSALARTGRPKLTVAVSPAGPGPLAGLADVTVPDPPALVALLERLIEDDHPSRP